jgi:thioredoxin-related protein
MDTKYLVALLLVAGLFGGVSNNYIGDYYSDSSEETNNNEIIEPVELGNQAPDFTITNVDGTDFNLSDFEGEKVIVLEFMNTGCGTCHNFEKNVLKSYYNNTTMPSDVEIISVTQGNEDRNKVADKAQGDWIYAIGNNEMTEAFDANRSPTVVIIDKEGIISFSKQGPLSEEELEKQVNSALA